MVLLLYSCKDGADKFDETAVYDFSSVSHYFYNYKNIKIACVPLSNKYTVNQYIFAANNIHVFSRMGIRNGMIFLFMLNAL